MKTLVVIAILLVAATFAFCAFLANTMTDPETGYEEARRARASVYAIIAAAATVAALVLSIRALA